MLFAIRCYFPSGRQRRGVNGIEVDSGYCLVPVRAIYESHATERITSGRTGKPVRRQYRFCLPGAHAFLHAAVHADGSFSVVTTTFNASVAPVRDLRALVLGPGESSVWLGPDFTSLSNRDAVRLSVAVER